MKPPKHFAIPISTAGRNHKATLVNIEGKVLGQCNVPDEVHIVAWGGGLFYRQENPGVVLRLDHYVYKQSPVFVPDNLARAAAPITITPPKGN